MVTGGKDLLESEDQMPPAVTYRRDTSWHAFDRRLARPASSGRLSSSSVEP